MKQPPPKTRNVFTIKIIVKDEIKSAESDTVGS